MNAGVFGSQTVWKRVSSNPADQRAWEDFHRHYWNEVFRWAQAMTRDETSAEEIAVDVFVRLFRRITNAELPRVEPDDQGSFRPYIHTIVAHLCADYRREPHRMKAAGLTEAVIARLEAPESVRDLGDRLEEREAMDRALEFYGDAYRRALQDVKSAPQYDPKTFQVFLRVYRDGKRPRDVDVEFGHPTPGLASKTANRVWERLFAAFGQQIRQGGGDVPAPGDLETILRELIQSHGDAPL